MKDYIIWGSSGHAKVIHEAILLNGGSVVALFDSSFDAKSVIDNVPIYYGLKEFHEWCQGNICSRKSINAVVAIGGQRGNERIQFRERFKNSHLRVPSVFHPTACISRSAKIGESCQILANATVSADVVIGNSSIINNLANVDHECVLGEGTHIAPGATLCGCVEVGALTLVGAGSVVLPRIKIGKNCIIGAGAVVTFNIPDNVIVAGNPAKYIKVNSK